MPSFEQYDEICKYLADGKQRDNDGNEKKAESAGRLNAYIYLIMDAQLNIQNGTFVSAMH